MYLGFDGVLRPLSFLLDNLKVVFTTQRKTIIGIRVAHKEPYYTYIENQSKGHAEDLELKTQSKLGCNQRNITPNGQDFKHSLSSQTV